jgi:hypothetical protein
VRTWGLSILGLVLLCAVLGLSATAHAHHNEIDHRTNKATWHFDFGVTTGMHDALIDGALVWDKVPSQCHDFLRLTGSSQVPQQRWYIDGNRGIFAVTGDAHHQVAYDDGDTWHLNVNVSPGPSSVDLWSIAAHEFGHVLYLSHSGVSSDTMAQYYDYGWYWARTLENGDRAGIQALYPTGSC